MMKVEKIIENGWNLNVSNYNKKINNNSIEELCKFLCLWSRIFPREDSWVQKEFGIPSLIVRVDCVEENGRIKIFEVEERPSGIGLARKFNKNFSSRLLEIQKMWPNFFSVVSPKRKSHDDGLWLEQISYSEALKNGKLLLVRAEPDENEFHSLTSKSVSTLITKGDKSYGEKMGLWKRVFIQDFENFPWDEGFCIKPIKSSKCRDVEIWHPEFSRKKKFNGIKIGGASTKSQIQKTLIKNGEMFLQPLIMPMLDLSLPNYFMAFRIFFGYNPKTNQYDFLGGLWNARKNLRIHGASDMIMGLAN